MGLYPFLVRLHVQINTQAYDIQYLMQLVLL